MKIKDLIKILQQFDSNWSVILSVAEEQDDFDGIPYELGIVREIQQITPGYYSWDKAEFVQSVPKNHNAIHLSSGGYDKLDE
jgi:hypothetical protein